MWLQQILTGHDDLEDHVALFQKLKLTDAEAFQVLNTLRRLPDETYGNDGFEFGLSQDAFRNQTIRLDRPQLETKTTLTIPGGHHWFD